MTAPNQTQVYCIKRQTYIDFVNRVMQTQQPNTPLVTEPQPCAILRTDIIQYFDKLPLELVSEDAFDFTADYLKITPYIVLKHGDKGYVLYKKNKEPEAVTNHGEYGIGIGSFLHTYLNASVVQSIRLAVTEALKDRLGIVITDDEAKGFHTSLMDHITIIYSDNKDGTISDNLGILCILNLDDHDELTHAHPYESEQTYVKLSELVKSDQYKPGVMEPWSLIAVSLMHEHFKLD